MCQYKQMVKLFLLHFFFLDRSLVNRGLDKVVDGWEGKQKMGIKRDLPILRRHRGGAASSWRPTSRTLLGPTLSAPSVGRTPPITSSTRRRRRTSTKEMETDRRAEEWSDTPSHEGDSQLHPSAGNEWTPVGDSLNGLICN